MQNKANFKKSQVNVRPLVIMNYERKSNWTFGENKPNSKPNKANQSQCFLLAHLAHTPQADIGTPIIGPKTNIHPEMNLKKLKKPQFSLKFHHRVSETKCPFTRYVSRQNLPGLS